MKALDHRPNHAAAIDLVALTREVYETLRAESDLSPANQRAADTITRFMNRLRSHYSHEDVDAVLDDPDVRALQPALRQYLSKAEYLTEAYESRRLSASSALGIAAVTALQSWPVYEALVGGELRLMKQLARTETPRTPIVFVGSGPLPLSPIALHLFGGADVICLERDADAYEASAALLERLELAEHVSVIHTDGADFDYQSYPLIMVASLVHEKHAVLQQIRRTQPDALVAVRTAEGLRRLMYEAVNEVELRDQGWLTLARTSPIENLVINSTLILAYSGGDALR